MNMNTPSPPPPLIYIFSEILGDTWSRETLFSFLIIVWGKRLASSAACSFQFYLHTHTQNTLPQSMWRTDDNELITLENK